MKCSLNKIASRLNHAVDPSLVLARCGMNEKFMNERNAVMNKIALGLNHAVDPNQILTRCGMNE